MGVSPQTRRTTTPPFGSMGQAADTAPKRFAAALLGIQVTACGDTVTRPNTSLVSRRLGRIGTPCDRSAEAAIVARHWPRGPDSSSRRLDREAKATKAPTVRAPIGMAMAQTPTLMAAAALKAIAKPANPIDDRVRLASRSLAYSLGQSSTAVPPPRPSRGQRHAGQITLSGGGWRTLAWWTPCRQPCLHPSCRRVI